MVSSPSRFKQQTNPENPETAPDTSARIFLAYDGSINADWVSRYAIRIAANAQNRKLFLLHIQDGSYPSEEINLKIKAIEDECAFHHVTLGHSILPFSGNVYKTLANSIPQGRKNFCICGARITSRGKGFLAGTISEKLLRAGKFNVLAIRVVQPGLLGCPENLLVPLAGRRIRHERARPFYQLLAPDILKVHFLRIVHINSWLLRYRSAAFKRAARKREFQLLRNILEEMREQDAFSSIGFDARVVLTGDWVHETLVQASRLHTRLVLLEGFEQNFVKRWFRDRRIEKILRRTTCDVALFRSI